MFHNLQNGAGLVAHLLLVRCGFAKGTLCLSNFADNLLKRLRDSVTRFGGELGVFEAALLGPLLALGGGDLALVDQIAFVAGQHNGHGLAPLAGALNLHQNLLQILQRVAVRHGKDEQKALRLADPRVAQRAKVVLAGRVQNVHQKLRVVDDNVALVRVLDGGVVQGGSDDNAFFVFGPFG